MKSRRLVVLLAVAGGIVALAVAVAPKLRHQVSTDEARGLVEKYNRAVCEAYRRCDVKLIDSVVGMNTVEGNRLTGLIGSRLDLGISLDAQLLSLEVTGVQHVGGELLIHTKEKWHYRDLKIGSGAQAGEDSTDYYEMLYIFRKFDGQWMVAETKFNATPQIGRKTVPWEMDREKAHSMMTAPGGKGEAHP